MDRTGQYRTVQYSTELLHTIWSNEKIYHNKLYTKPSPSQGEG